MKKEYTTLSMNPVLKDQFVRANIDWNLTHPSQRKTKEEFLEMLLNILKEKERKER